ASTRSRSGRRATSSARATVCGSSSRAATRSISSAAGRTGRSSCRPTTPSSRGGRTARACCCPSSRGRSPRSVVDEREDPRRRPLGADDLGEGGEELEALADELRQARRLRDQDDALLEERPVDDEVLAAELRQARRVLLEEVEADRLRLARG